MPNYKYTIIRQQQARLTIPKRTVPLLVFSLPLPVLVWLVLPVHARAPSASGAPAGVCELTSHSGASSGQSQPANGSHHKAVITNLGKCSRSMRIRLKYQEWKWTKYKSTHLISRIRAIKVKWFKMYNENWNKHLPN